MMTDTRDDQRAEIELKIQAHRKWLVTETAGSVSLTTAQYAKWRAELTALQAEQRRVVAQS